MFLGRPRVGGELTDGVHGVAKDWIIDTGADGSSISKDNFDAIVKKGAKPNLLGVIKGKSAFDKVSVPIYGGLKMRFARNNAKRKPELVDCETPLTVGVVDLLGVDQLKNTKTRLLFDPAGGNVELRGPK